MENKFGFKRFRHPDGSIVYLPKIPVSSLAGILPKPDVPATLEDIDDAIAAGATARFLNTEE